MNLKKIMIEVYKNYIKHHKKYNNSNIINFEFENGNSLFEDTLYDNYYKNEDYVREESYNIYIYNNASPIVVSKEKAKLTKN